MKRPTSQLLALVVCFMLTTPWLAYANDSTSTSIDADLEEALYRKFEGLPSSASDVRSLDPIRIQGDAIADSIAERRARAHTLLQQVLSGQRFLESLDELSEIDLPVGLVKSGGALDYSILIDRIQITKEGAIMDVYMSLALPQTGSRIAFYGAVPLSAEGGVAGNAKIYLLGDHRMALSNSTLLTIRGTRETYAEFDCSGFLGVNLSGELQFSTDVLVPENENGEPLDERLKASFNSYTSSLNDILVSLTLPPFQVRNLRGFGFHVTKAYLDWSDLANPPELSFPMGYTSPFLEVGLDNLWQGIFLGDVEIKLPPSFSRQGTNHRVAVGARQMIIDEQGLSGSLYTENIFSDGDMNGWTYSLDVISLQLLANHVNGLTIKGRLTIPVVKGKDGKNTAFSYIAQRSNQGDYIFSVSVEDELRLDLWVADMKLMQGSRVIVTEKENKFYPSAHLNGELSINIAGKGPKASFNSLRFENMVINSEAPYFQPGTFGFGREGQNSSLLKYPVVFDNVAIKADDRRVGIAFDLIVNITGDPDDESFAGKAGLVVWGVQDGEPKRDAAGKVIGLDQRTWAFDKVELTSVRINIKKPGVLELVGEVRFFDEDKIYGEGFKGSLKGSIHKIKVEAQALFGRTEAFRYWYADALVELSTGIPIVPGVLSAFGFGGGYYSKMRQASEPVDGTLGRSPSGITYVPDENALGIRAVVLIGTPRPEAMRGDVALEVSLNRHGGINSITFTGNANFMSVGETGAKKIKELAAAAVAGKLTEKLSSFAQGQVYGSVRLHFDNINDIFHGNLEIYVNVAGGIVRGVSAGNKAGWAVMHFEHKDWYIHIGTPDQPLGLEVARIFKAKSYFMLGKNLPGSPPPPPQVSEILGNVDLDYMRDMNALESGMGIAFGLHFLVDTGELRFLMFYGRFSAGTGLDFMLKDYGNEYHCAGMSGPMGINGWYANGQAYAFVTGKIGIKVNLRFYKGKYEILNIGAAAILQAKGPNPFWMKGTVGGYYRILGGLVKGRCRFDLTVGTECRPVADENLLEEVSMIAGITPAPSSVDVSVFNAPQVAFNIPVGEVFEIRDMEKTHYFRAVLDEFTLMDGSRRINGTLVWNDARDVVAFDANDLLPGEKRLTARARLSFEEKSNNVWSKVKFGGKVVSETAESEFQTGKAPDFLPESNIAFSYPLPNQRNFFPKEYSQGFIQLRDGQPYLFNPGSEWIQVVRMTEMSSGQILETNLSYNTRTRRIAFSIPDGFINSASYQFQIVNKPRHVTTVDANVSRVDRELLEDSNAGTAVLTTQEFEGDLDILETKIIFNAAFRTSQYNTFVEKMRDVHLSDVMRLSPGINIFQLAAYFRGRENFDAIEARSPEGGLIQPEAILENNLWYQSYVYPLVYEGYPLYGWMKVRRPDAFVLGVPPIRDIHFANITSTNAGAFDIASTQFTNEMLIYNLGQSVASDFFDMQRHAVNYVADHPSEITPRLQSLILQPLPYLRYGPYRLRFNYVIPGIDKRTSSYETEIFNPVPDND